jgi:NSS family neurotransmitter:Na+ symporter
MTHQRPRFTSLFGALMALIGVAVGLGNVWRFPYMAAAFGGGAFLLVYLALLFLIGIPALTAEFTLGRMTRRGPMGAFRRIGMPGGSAVGWVLFVTMLMALSYYTVVVGWVLRYVVVSLSGRIGSIEPQAFFDSVLGGFGGQFLFTAVILALAIWVLLTGIHRGVQRVSSVGMPMLFVLLVVLIGRSLTLPGAMDGLRFYLVPDFSKVDAGVVAAALGQLFFSVGLGGTFMVTYASYIKDDVDLGNSAFKVGVGETLASILAGLVVIPAAVSLGIELNSGPPFTFVTAPTIFAGIPGGSVFASLFFSLLLLAAFLSVVAGMEVLIAGAVDELGWSRRQATIGFGVAVLLLGTLPMLSLDYILKSDLFWGSTMQPVGSALALIGLAWIVGLGRALEEANKGRTGRPIGRLWFFWIKYVVPLAVALILALGLKSLFEAF